MRAVSYGIAAALCAVLVCPAIVLSQDDDIAQIRAYMNRGDYASGARKAEQVLAAHPKDADVMVVYGFGMLWSRDFSKAESLFMRVLEIAPDYGDAAIGLVKTYTWGEQPAKLRGFLAKHGERFKAQSYTRLEILQAELRIEMIDHPDEYTPNAVKIAEAILKADPRNRAALGVVRGAASPGVSRYIREAEKALKDGRYTDAEINYSKAIELDPANDDIRISHARVMSWNQKNEESLRAIAVVLERSPRNTDALNVQARIYAWTSQPVEAEAAYKRALSIQPDNGDAKRGLADVLRWLGKYDEGIKLSAELVAAYPADEEVASGHARILGLMGKHDDAIAFLKKFLDQYPGATQARAALANEYAASKRLTDAVNELRKSIQLDANNKSAYLSLGKLYSWQDQTDQAVSLYQAVLDRDPENGAALTGMGNTYRYAGLNAKAMDYYHRALAIDPSNADAADALRMVHESIAPQVRARYSFSRFDDAIAPGNTIRTKTYTEERLVDYQFNPAPDQKLLFKTSVANLIEKDKRAGDRNYDLDRESYGARWSSQWSAKHSSVFNVVLHEYEQGAPAFSPLTSKRRRADFYLLLQRRDGSNVTTLLYSQDDYIANQTTGNLKIGNIVSYDASHQRDLWPGLTVVAEATADWFSITRTTRETYQGRATYKFRKIEGAGMEITMKHVTTPSTMIFDGRLFWARYSPESKRYIYAHYKFDHEDKFHDSYHEGNVLYSAPMGKRKNLDYTIETRYTDYFSGDRSWNATGYLTYKY